MDMLAAMGVAALIEVLKDKKAVVRLCEKFAKVYVAIERAAEMNPTLAGAIAKARTRP